MHRLIVLLLAAVDAAIAAAVGIAATLAPLTVLWVLGMGGTAEWGTLWPAGAAVWQLGHLVPLHVTLPGDYLAVAGIDPTAASFVLSLAPLAFAVFTAIFAARSGVRASQADAWVTGVITGAVVFTALAGVIALTSGTAIADVELWQAILMPALVYAVPLCAGAVVTEWREAGSGVIARVRDRVEAAPHGWADVVGLTARGTAVVLAGLIGLGALAFAVALLLRGGEVIALFEAAHVDTLGAVIVTLTQLAYLPTLAIWGMSFVAGPGFAVGVDTAVSPAGTQLGVIPGIPVLGALPESTTPWLLLLALLPIGLGALSGWIVRSRLAAPTLAEPAAAGRDAASDVTRSPALSALLAGSDAHRSFAASPSPEVSGPAGGASDDAADDPIGARLVIALGIAVLSGAGAALLCLLASGSIGPARLAEVGPQPGPVALAVGAEVLVGAAILLLSPRRRSRAGRSDRDRDGAEPAAKPAGEPASEAFAWSPSSAPTEPVELPGAWTPVAHGIRSASDDAAREPDAAPEPEREPAPATGSDDPDDTPTVDLGPRRPKPLPPID
ncbi:DUF6350 family protein [Microbacterium sp. zg.B48]|uniref:cell division protein PerM n=1 Tax=Microbacterium sp. zg.B48 TaxID=2969408 RepID=UPI00214C8F33|nr:DUF6350 family protein [Microbacterium sp. zg.B48]MCR2764079.1 DUF6350 family protein [Microbacterium sp. zg.B48]